MVDAGGTGYLLCSTPCSRGRRPAAARAAPAARRGRRRWPRRPAPAAAPTHEATASGDLRYEVMYLLEAPDDTIAAFKEVWAGHRRLDRGGGRRRAVELPHPHRRRRGGHRGGPRRRPAPRHPGHRPGRAGRGGALGPRGRRAARTGDADAGPPPTHRRGGRGHRATASAGSSARSASTTWSPGGQSMNPSTAEILEAVEAARLRPRWCSCPTTRTSARWPSRSTSSTDKTVRVVPTGEHRRGLRRPPRLRPRRPGVEDNAAAMAASARRVVAGEVTQAVRDADDRRPARSRAGDWIGLSRDGVVVGGRLAVGGAPARLLDRLLVTDDHELVTLIEGEGADAGRHPADHRVAARRAPRRGRRGPPRRPAALPVPLRHRVSRPAPTAPAADAATADRGRTLRSWPSSRSTGCRCARPRRRRPSADWGVDIGPRPADHLPPPLHRPHPPGRPGRPGRGRGGGGAGRRSTPVAARAGPAAAGPWSSSTSTTAPATMKVIFFNQPWRAKQLPVGHRGAVLRQARRRTGARARWSTRWSTSRRGGRRAAPADAGRCGSSPSTRPRRRPGSPAGSSGEWVAEALRRAGDLRRPPARGLARAELDLVGGPRPCAGIHLPETLADAAPARRRLAFDELFRLQLALVLRRRALERDARGIRHAVGPRRTADRRAAAPLGDRRPRWSAVPRRPPLRADRGPAPGHGRDLRRPGRAAAHAPAPPGRRRVGQDGGGAWPRLLAAVQGGHQGALMVPTEVLAEQHFFACGELRRRPRASPDPGRLGGARPLAVALLTNRTTAAERTAAARGPARRRGRPGGRDPRAADRRRAVPLASGWWSSTSSTASGSSSAPRCGPRAGGGRPASDGRRPRPAGHDGHAHPADRGHGASSAIST